MISNHDMHHSMHHHMHSTHHEAMDGVTDTFSRDTAGLPDAIAPETVVLQPDEVFELRASRESLIGKYLMKVDPFPGKGLALKQLRQQGVRVVGRLMHVDGKMVTFASGETAAVETVI